MTAIQHHFSLKDCNSFGIDVRAALYSTPKTPEQIVSIMDQVDFRNLPILVMGEGSNLLFKDNFEGLVLNPRIKGIELVEEDSVVVAEVSGVGVVVEAGETGFMQLDCPDGQEQANQPGMMSLILQVCQR